MKKISNYKTLYISAFVIMIIIIIIFCCIYDKKESEKISIEHQTIGIENLENSTKEGQTEESRTGEDYIIVHVAGEVNNPGVYELNKNARVKDAIDAANGITENANMANVNLAYSLADGQKINIPSSGSDASYQNATEIVSGGRRKN
ncbi:MAG: SLBB domain-containing protein [Clostridia bacterium]|nr:SLBB domain-containing protein [Clostridia bacterium]